MHAGSCVVLFIVHQATDQLPGVLVFTRSQINPVGALPSYLFGVRFNIILSFTYDLPSCLFPLR